MVARFTRSKLCIALITSTVAFNLTGCKSSRDYESILKENQFKYECENNHVLLVDSNVCDEDILKLPDDLVSLELFRCNYLTNLDNLSVSCPNIKYLRIDGCASLDDFSFVYDLVNLEYLDINESAFVTQELVDYLDEINIRHTITEEDLIEVQKVDEILNNITTDDMDDEDKVRAIACYIMNEYSYDIKSVNTSNLYPLSSFIRTGKGVCASYSYLANALLRKANINSYEIMSNDHGWNLLEFDGKYYYLDSTNLDFFPIISEIILKNFGIGFYYLNDPSCTILSAMDKYDDIENVIIPNSLIMDIKAGEDEKNIIEKYKNSVPVIMIEAIIVLLTFLNIFFSGKIYLETHKGIHGIKK